MSFVRQIKIAAAAMAVSAVFCGGALAAPVPFTWNPAGATPSLAGGAIVNATDYYVADFASAQGTPPAGTFPQTAARHILNCPNCAPRVPPPPKARPPCWYHREPGGARRAGR